MAEYIDKNIALSFPFANGEYDHDHANEHFIYGCETYKEWLETLPAADVRENTIRTQADRIRAMNDEELAQFFPCTASEFSCHPGATNEDCKKVGGWWRGCPQCWLDWLQSPADGGDWDATN